MIHIKYHSCTQVVLDGPELNIIREHFSVKNEAAHFQRRMGRFVPSRTYVITNNGKVDIGLLEEIIEFCMQKSIAVMQSEDIKNEMLDVLSKHRINVEYDGTINTRLRVSMAAKDVNAGTFNLVELR